MNKHDKESRMKVGRKSSIIIVYTGDGKGKTSAAIGLLARALGAGRKVAFVQFIKSWEVSEHKFFASIKPVYDDNFTFYKGVKGFYNAGEASAKNVTDAEHRNAAQGTFDFTMEAAISGNYDLVICDEINNAVADGLLTTDDLEKLIKVRNEKTSLCLTGRNWPSRLSELADIVTEMKKVKHHYDDGFLAEEGIDF